MTPHSLLPGPPLQSRREFLRVLAGATAATLVGCHSSTGTDAPGGGSARLSARAGTPTLDITPGKYQLTPDNPNDGFLVVPSGYDPAHAAPLVLALHGAGGSPEGPINLLGSYAEAHGFLLLSAGSRGLTWDVFTYRYSYDVTFIDGALRWTFDRCAVDASHIIIEGFSDGASYALGLGLANGDLFSHTVAFSPGFIPRSDSPAVGRSRFFLSHGRQDDVLHIDTASRRIVPDLRRRGYDVTYVEFDGGHEVPAAIATQAVEWMLG